MLFGFSLDEIILNGVYIYLSFTFLRILFWVYKVSFRRRKNHLQNYGKNSWVLITGASEGVGKSFALEFSRIGFNIILVSRDIKKLKKCEEIIKNVNNQSKVICVPFDFSKHFTIKDYEATFAPIFAENDISVLINNVGLRDVRKYTEFTLEEVHSITTVNTLPQTLLTKLLLEKFVQRKNRSAVINISSSSSVYPLPQFVLYSSTKIFSDYFSRALSYEIQNKVDVLSATPFFINSSTVKLTPNSFTVITCEQFVNAVIDQLGFERHTYGFWSQQIIGSVFEKVVEYILFFVVYQLKKRKINSEKSG